VIDSNARMASLALRLNEIQLEALRSQYTVYMASSEIQRLFNKAKRLEQELNESEQFSINIQAARNDPNVRIYRNDAVINADISFKDALREAYRATKVYEYYTSQSYAELEQLFLIRMVQFGDYNLANYLANLEKGVVSKLHLEIALRESDAFGEQITVHKAHRRKGLSTRLRYIFYTYLRADTA